ncbi:putative Integral membrane protein [Streptomyces viridochromogenes Tue57]|uniref:Putative Integral membrane protein n=1 Tax=Streptomyces viridochromogenes Tue57 TaxID=1160705 RepID=L8PBZ0_STRVR|nr:putative Integral membrane protein [Streptomyces viridochromogenes Tue57]
MQKMLQLMASGGPVELTSPMASVKKLARLAFIAQQFGYEYLDVRQSTGRNGALIMMIAPDPSPQARARAAQNWAQYPNAGDGVSLPPLVPDAFELLKARINFDLTGKSAEKRAGYAAVGVTLGAAILGVRLGADASAWIVALLTWVFFMAVLGVVFVVNRKRNVKFAARLQAAGFMPVTDDTGRVRYLPPGAQLPGQPFAAGPYGNQPPSAPAGYGRQAPGPHAGQPAAPEAYPGQPPASAPGAYPAQPSAPAAPVPGPYGNQPAPGPYTAPHTQGPYGAPQLPQQPHQPLSPQQPQQPHPQQPYGQPQPHPQPYPQQNPHWQPPQH